MEQWKHWEFYWVAFHGLRWTIYVWLTLNQNTFNIEARWQCTFWDLGKTHPKFNVAFGQYHSIKQF